MSVYVLRARPSVRFERILPAGFRILAALDRAAQTIEHDIEVTSGTDSHAKGRHPTGEAYDVSVAELSDRQIVQLWTCLRETLGRAFTVLFESPMLPRAVQLINIVTVNKAATGPHIHIQPRKGTVYPPPFPSTDTVRV